MGPEVFLENHDLKNKKQHNPIEKIMTMPHTHIRCETSSTFN